MGQVVNFLFHRVGARPADDPQTRRFRGAVHPGPRHQSFEALRASLGDEISRGRSALDDESDRLAARLVDLLGHLSTSRLHLVTEGGLEETLDLREIPVGLLGLRQDGASLDRPQLERQDRDPGACCSDDLIDLFLPRDQEGGQRRERHRQKIRPRAGIGEVIRHWHGLPHPARAGKPVDRSPPRARRALSKTERRAPPWQPSPRAWRRPRAPPR